MPVLDRVWLKEDNFFLKSIDNEAESNYLNLKKDNFLPKSIDRVEKYMQAICGSQNISKIPGVYAYPLQEYSQEPISPIKKVKTSSILNTSYLKEQLLSLSQTSEYERGSQARTSQSTKKPTSLALGIQVDFRA